MTAFSLVPRKRARFEVAEGCEAVEVRWFRALESGMEGSRRTREMKRGVEGACEERECVQRQGKRRAHVELITNGPRPPLARPALEEVHRPRGRHRQEQVLGLPHSVLVFVVLCEVELGLR